MSAWPSPAEIGLTTHLTIARRDCFGGGHLRSLCLWYKSGMTSGDAVPGPAAVRPSPAFWARLPVLAGNLLQLAGIVAGVLVIILAGAVRSAGALSTLIAVLGILLVYLCCHAIAHWLVGRLVGLRFAFVGVRGTDHPEAYPPGMRQIMAVTPMFTTVSTRQSRAAVGRRALAAYFAAGETSTTLCTVLAAVLALLVGVPGAGVILVVAIVWVLLAVVTTTFTPKGDYYKARQALRPS